MRGMPLQPCARADRGASQRSATRRSGAARLAARTGRLVPAIIEAGVAPHSHISCPSRDKPAIERLSLPREAGEGGSLHSSETGGGPLRQRTPPVRLASPIGHPPLCKGEGSARPDPCGGFL